MGLEKPIKTSIIALVVLISLAATVLIGGTVISGYSQTLRDANTAVVNESLTLDNGAGVALANVYVQEITLIEVNFSGGVWETLTAAEYSLVDGDTLTTGKVVLDNSSKDGNLSLVTYTYRAANTNSGFADTFNTGIVIFATFMGVLVLAFIGKLITDIFMRNKN